MRGGVTMSQRELDRYLILNQVIERKITQNTAADLLGLKERHIRNLIKALRLHGPKGLISKQRGAPSNRRKPLEAKQQILTLITEHFEGFGPTFAGEKLFEYYGIKVATETLRSWMIEAHLWVPRRGRTVVHRLRQRRACFGELIQADGSHHRWFGDDNPMVNLTVMVDDATGKLTGLHFSPTETFESYVEVIQQHLQSHGRLRALYTTGGLPV